MKEITSILPVLLILATFSTTANAAQQMRDMSLSVEETNHQLATPQQPRANVADPGFYNDSDRNGNYDYNENNAYNGNNNNNTFDANTPISPNINDMTGAAGIPAQANSQLQNNNVIGRRLPPPSRGMNRGFINKFCSSDYAPKNASSEAQQSCMDTQRQEACERFQHAAVNIQRVLSQAIDCEANSSGYNDSECDGLDASRLDMLKQYWQDEDTSYTILFLPDMVVNSAANCSPSNRHATN